jgi:PAS domain S-box-containing protein
MNATASAADPDRRPTPAAIAGTYATAGALWIVFSDQLAATLANSALHLTVLQTYKGWAFVMLTTALLYLLLRRGRRAEDALHARIEGQARQYLSLFEANPLPMWVYDLESLAFLAVNDAALEHYGYSRTEFLGMTIADIRPAEDVPALQRNVAQVGSGIDHAGVWRHRKKGGALIDVEITSSTLSFEGRRAELVLAHDVTAERAAQRRVADAEERLRLALAAAHQGLYDLNLQTGETQINDAYAEMLGYAPGELVETNAAWLARLHPEDRDRVGRVYADYVAGRLPEYRVEFRQRTRQGSWKWILSLGRVMQRDASGAPLRMLGTHTDIDAEKQAQARIRRLTNQYAALSQCNQAIARVGERSELLREVCRVAVDYGGLRMAWIGELREDRVVPVASFGARTDYAADADIRLDPSLPTGRGPTATALREARHVICDDVEGDPLMAPWRERALDCGFRASAAFPLRRAGKPWGSLTLYAPEARFFDPELVELLDKMATDISFALDRFRLEAEQRAAEERFRALVDHAADAVFIADLDGRIIDANARACASLGYSREELLGRNVTELDPAAAALGTDEVRRIHSAAFDQGQLYLGRHRRKDGSTFPVEVRIAGIRLADGDYVVGMARDVTERQRAERALKDSERRLRRISQAISDVAYSCRGVGDGDFEIDWILGAVERITGFSEEELMDRRCWRRLVVADDQELFRQRVTGLAPGSSGSCELRLQRKDGSVVWVSSVAECAHDDQDPAAHRLYGGLTDITERKRAEEALRESEARLRRVVDEMPVMFDALDDQGLVIHWNRECERVTGYSASEIVGNPAAMALLYPDAAYREHMLRLWQERGHAYRDWEWSLTARDGSTRHIAWSNVSGAAPIPGWPAWGIGVDVTARRAAETALAEYTERLQSLSRRLLSVQEEERRAMARELHDEIGQQLAALKLNLTVMLRAGAPAPDPRRLTDCIEIADLTIERIRDTALNLRPSVLDDLGLTSALHWYARRQAQRAGCHIEVRATVPPLPGEVETALFRITQEAVNNAIRHGRAQRVDVVLELADNFVHLRVDDDGIGFDTTAAGGGMGLLGMRERAELLGGRLALDSRPGAGTRLGAEIPLDWSAT